MGRIGAFTRKAAPAAVVDDTGGDTGPDDGTVECPECKCQFDPTTQEVTKPGEYDGGGDETNGPQGGPDLALPPSTPDPQAPVGSDAVTRALASVLGG